MEITLNGVRYSSVRLDAFKQFHIARRLAPVVLSLGMGAALMMKFKEANASATPKSKEAEAQDDLAALAMAGKPIADVLAAMSDTDSECVLKLCLGVVSREQSGGAGWAPLMNSAGTLQFNDLGLIQMVQLAHAVVLENLGNFMPAPPIAPSTTATPRGQS